MRTYRITWLLLLAATLLFMSGPAAAQMFNAASDFSPTSNPNGAWSYGWSSSRGADFNLVTVPINVCGVDDATGYFVCPGLDTWWRGYFDPPVVFHNGRADTIRTACCNPLPPGGFGLHPGFSGENAIVRWTAPAKGLYKVTATFSGLDTAGTTTDVAILHNGSQQLFAGNVSGYGSPSAQSYSGTVSVLAGDTIDFTVGYGADGTYDSDGTVLDAIIETEMQALIDDLTKLINSSNLSAQSKSLLLGYVQRIPAVINLLTPAQKQAAIQNLRNLITALKFAMSAHWIPAALGNQLINDANEAILVLSS